MGPPCATTHAHTQQHPAPPRTNATLNVIFPTRRQLDVSSDDSAAASGRFTLSVSVSLHSVSLCFLSHRPHSLTVVFGFRRIRVHRRQGRRIHRARDAFDRGRGVTPPRAQEASHEGDALSGHARPAAPQGLLHAGGARRRRRPRVRPPPVSLHRPTALYLLAPPPPLRPPCRSSVSPWCRSTERQKDIDCVFRPKQRGQTLDCRRGG